VVPSLNHAKQRRFIAQLRARFSLQAPLASWSACGRLYWNAANASSRDVEHEAPEAAPERAIAGDCARYEDQAVDGASTADGGPTMLVLGSLPLI